MGAQGGCASGRQRARAAGPDLKTQNLKPPELEAQTRVQGVGEELWVLKEDAHRGAGVHVLPAAAAVREARQLWPRGGAQGAAGDPAGGASAGGGSYDLVQQYVRDQLTIDGRKFYVRCCSLAVAVRAALAPAGLFWGEPGCLPRALRLGTSPTSPRCCRAHGRSVTMYRSVQAYHTA